ncbi:MAG TPA: universal stress protein, partial [Anaerolineales bacterium]|nr:universal stress protein [Anaerolineales bacterium]
MIKHLLRDPFHIMLAVDGSDHALAAAQLINTLPLPPRSQVTLVGVLAPKRSPRQSALLAACAELQTILERSELIVKSGLLHGHPAEELASFADMIRP